MRIAYSWHGGRRDFTKTARRRPLDEPYALAPPAPAPLPISDLSDLVASPRETSPARRAVRMELADEPAMSAAEVKARATDFAVWRARHRRQHRH